MIEIAIQGLNPRQCAIADMLWAFEDGEDAIRFIKSMPTLALRLEAQSIKDLMLMAAVEQAYEGAGNTSDADQVISQLISKK